MTEERKALVRQASEILFGDPDWVSSRPFMASQMDDRFWHPHKDRLVSINQLADELDAKSRSETIEMGSGGLCFGGHID